MPYWICKHKLTKEKIRRCKGCVGGHSVPRVVFQFSSKSLLSSVFLLSLSLSSQTWREQHQHCRRSKFSLICEKVISDFVLFSDLQLCVSSVSDNTGCVLQVWLEVNSFQCGNLQCKCLHQLCASSIGGSELFFSLVICK